MGHSEQIYRPVLKTALLKVIKRTIFLILYFNFIDKMYKTLRLRINKLSPHLFHKTSKNYDWLPLNVLPYYILLQQ